MDDSTGSGVGRASVVCCLPFPVRQAGKWGFIDKTGRVVIDFQYDDARDFQDGMAAVRVGAEWGYIDESGTMVIDPRFDEDPVYFNSGLAQVDTPNGIGYMDKTGRVVIPGDPDRLGAYQFSEGLAGVKREGGAGFMDTSGKLVIWLPGATDAGYFSEGLASVRVGPSEGYIDRTGKLVIEPDLFRGSEFSDGLAVVSYGEGKHDLIDRTGKVLRKLDYTQVGRFSEGRLAVMHSEKFPHGSWGYVDAAGHLVIPLQFAFAWDFRGGLARVEDLNDKLGYIDLDGNYVWREQ